MSTHQHDHSHDTTRDSQRRLLFTLVLTGSFMVIEVVGGMMSGSLALLADAGHMLTDTAALTLGWLGARLSVRPADQLRSYGYHRFQVITALINGLGFLLMVIWIAYEAWQRLHQPIEVLGGPMLAVATAGLVVNGIAFKLLHAGHSNDINLRAATLHVLGDLLGSVAAIVAAAVILTTGWTPIDPLLSLFVAVLIAGNAIQLVRQSVHILLEGSPQDIDVDHIQEELVRVVPDVTSVHHVHVWSLTPQHPVLTMHVDVSSLDDYQRTLSRIQSTLTEVFGIEHATVQLEIGGCTDTHNCNHSAAH